MAICFCGFDHSANMSRELRLLAHAYHDIFQGAIPDKTWMKRVKSLQGRPTLRAVDAATGAQAEGAPDAPPRH